MKLAIVGSRTLKDHPQVLAMIDEALDRLKPTLVISGGAIGPDTHAIEIARRKGIATKQYLPETADWETGYKRRNEQIADNCDFLIAFLDPTSKTRGAGWTARYCQQKYGLEKVQLIRITP